MTQPLNVQIPQCPSLSIAGRRCEKSKLHNTFETSPVHEAGGLIWSKGRAEQVDLAESVRQMASGLGVPLEPWQAQVAESYFGIKEEPVTPEQQLAQWWRDKAEAEIAQTVAKAVEYGSTDLIDIGRSLARVAGRDTETFDDEAAEMGIFFYLEGKLSRWRSALERGERPSDDTLLDIGVYVRMAQRIRSHGGWPGIEPDASVQTVGVMGNLTWDDGKAFDFGKPTARERGCPVAFDSSLPQSACTCDDAKRKKKKGKK